MQVRLDVSHVKQPRRNLYYTKCTIAFTNEEKAIIRERALFDHALSFEKGYVNFPPTAGLNRGATFLAYCAVLFIAALASFAISQALPLALFLASGLMYILYKSADHEDATAYKQSIKIADIVRNGPFTLCAFDNPLESKLVEYEIRNQLGSIKTLITFSGQPIESTAFEV